MTTVKGTFTVLSWNEETYEESDGRKLTRAEVSQRFGGDIAGEGAAIWLMVYRPDGTAHFVGLQRITATIAGRVGTVVFETSGDFDGQVASWKATTVAGAASEGPEGLRGHGTFEAPMGSEASFALDYELA